MIKSLRINNFIRTAEVQVIGHDGAQLGTMSIQDALLKAKDADLDLVEVGPNVAPPICKIMDYGKYMYQKERQEKKSGAAKKQQQGQKTVRVGFKTGAHDIAFKTEKVKEFLGEGNIVKVELTLRGREKALAHLGKQKLEQFIANLGEEITTQDPVKRGPYGWTTIIIKKKP